MTSNLKRKQDIGYYALPAQGTKAFDDKIKQLKEYSKANPQNDKIISERFRKAVTIIKAQLENGAGFPLDQEVRYFLNSFNHRTFEYGLRTMPSSFNVLEGFFNYHPDLNYFELLEEENNLFSLFDYVDFITSPDFNEDKQLILDHLQEDLIYHYDISNDLNEITFTTEDGGEYVVAGISLLRRGHEVLVFLLTGLITDIAEETKKLTFDYKPVSGREHIKVPEDRERGAEKLLGNSNFWKTLAYCRIDLNKSTIDTRYIQQDVGTMFNTITDDISGYIDSKGEIKPQFQHIYEKGKKDIVPFSPLFELATKCLYLPFYFDKFENEITQEEHPTKFKELPRTKAYFKREIRVPIPAEYKIKSRTVWCLYRNSTLKSDIVYFGENEFKIDRTGFWKNIEVGAIGKDKNGNKIHGKTWVDKTLSWYESDTQTLSANFKNTIKAQAIKNNQGYIYLMRNASHEINIFKIGLTRSNSVERARKLSSTTSSPDKFLVAHEWLVDDCVLMEKMIHAKLEKYRVNLSREYFKIDFSLAMTIINDMVNSIKY